MCQFCTEHGEGKKWYLQMKNYSDELLHQELSKKQKELTSASTRREWLSRSFGSFVVPAIPGMARPEEKQTENQPTEKPKIQPTEDEIVARRKAVHFAQVLPIEDVEKAIDVASSITRMPCGCRFISTGKADKRYCFGLALDSHGVLNEFPDAASSLEVLEKEEAKKIFRKYDEEGLMHSIWTGITPYIEGICNCDRDCLPYKSYIEKGGPPNFFRSEYICQVDPDTCTGCKDCMKQCQFGSQFYSSALGKVYIDPERCYGCGVCRAACPNDAIELIPRKDVPEAANLWLKKESRAP